jgi:hypothetical protein
MIGLGLFLHIHLPRRPGSRGKGDGRECRYGQASASRLL